MAGLPGSKELYDVQKRGAEAPVYSPAEEMYRNKLLNELQTAYQVREQNHMEFNDMTYSQIYLKNRQQDMAYNPPKRNRADSRIVSGTIHEKDNTILSLITSMNFQPRVTVKDKNDVELVDAGQVLTAMLKKSLQDDEFKKRSPEMFRTNIAQGNVFVETRRKVKWTAKKVPTGNNQGDPTKLKWKTIMKEIDCGVTTDLIPNTGVFLGNIREPYLKKQPYIFLVTHLPTEDVAQVYKDFPRWKNVPKDPTETVQASVDGVFGDFYLRLPRQGFTEVIVFQSEPRNEFNVMLNGVMMYNVQNEDGLITGYPLTEVSPTGEYTISKGDNELIPFFAYGRSVPSKNEVKEETLNELMRLMVYKIRQSAKPPIGNNSDKVLPSNIWDPSVITPDISKDDLSILTPNAGVTAADFSFYNLIQSSIAESSVSPSVEGTNNAEVTATQFVDQKKANLKKLGLSIDNVIEFLKDVYWTRLMLEIDRINRKENKTAEDNEILEAYESFAVDETINGKTGKVRVNFLEEGVYAPTSQAIDELEQESRENVKMYFIEPEMFKKRMWELRDKMDIEVISEPDGQEQALLGALFNLITQYGNLKGDTQNVNFDYLEQIIGQNSGFDATQLFLKNKPQMNPAMQQQGGMAGGDLPGISPEGGSQPRFNKRPASSKQANSILANAT